MLDVELRRMPNCLMPRLPQTSVAMSRSRSIASTTCRLCLTTKPAGEGGAKESYREKRGFHLENRVAKEPTRPSAAGRFRDPTPPNQCSCELVSTNIGQNPDLVSIQQACRKCRTTLDPSAVRKEETLNERRTGLAPGRSTSTS